jgi:hypothetical protein
VQATPAGIDSSLVDASDDTSAGAGEWSKHHQTLTEDRSAAHDGASRQGNQFEQGAIEVP